MVFLLFLEAILCSKIHPKTIKNQSKNQSKNQWVSEAIFHSKNVPKYLEHPPKIYSKSLKKRIYGKYARPHENTAPANKIKGPGLSKILKKTLKNY